jgi:hypothetical protein
MARARDYLFVLLFVLTQKPNNKNEITTVVMKLSDS